MKIKAIFHSFVHFSKTLIRYTWHIRVYVLTIACTMNTDHERIRSDRARHEKTRRTHWTFEKMQTNQKSLCKAAYWRFLWWIFALVRSATVYPSIGIGRCVRSCCVQCAFYSWRTKHTQNTTRKKPTITSASNLALWLFAHMVPLTISILYNLFQVLRMGHTMHIPLIASNILEYTTLKWFPLEWSTAFLLFIWSVDGFAW